MCDDVLASTSVSRLMFTLTSTRSLAIMLLINQQFPLRLMTIAVGFALSTSLYADEKPRSISLKELTVTASHGEQDILNVANTVSVITEEDIQKQQASSVKDLLRYESGVSVRSQPMRAGAALSSVGRGGNEGINIRGLEGNQVTLQTDGVRLPALYTFGPIVSGRGDYLEPEGYRRVEILRGPSSTLFGSEGLAGAVSFVTKDPEDLLTLGKDVQFNLRAGYASEDHSWFSTPSFAARNEHVSGMLLYTQRDGEQLRNRGSNDVAGSLRTTPNPQSKESEYWLGKLVWDVNDEHQLKLTAEKLDRNANTDILSGLGPGFMPSLGTTTDLNSKDRVRRDLYKLDYQYQSETNSYVQMARASLYQQESRNRQFTDERRTVGDRTRDNEYKENIQGVNLVLESRFGQNTVHTLHYGLDYSTTDVKGLRQATPVGPGFPDKPFPDTDYRLLGLFIQDEISIGRLSIIPGLRYDSYKLSPSGNDPLYVGVDPAPLSDNAISTKLGFVWRQAPLLNIFAQYSEGFRAPSPQDVNSGFANLTGPRPYQTIANPDLNPETSKMYEVGIRGRDDRLRYSFSVFRADYKDFIEQARVGGLGSVASPTLFQSINLNKVNVTGVEGSARWNIDSLWAVSTSFSWNRGNTIDEGEKLPLRTIDPAKIMMGLHYDQGHYYGDLMLTHVQAKKRLPDPNGYSPDSFTTLDLMAGWQITTNANLQAGVFNITDEAYTHWADVRDLSATSQVVDAFTQPGRNFKISFNYEF